MSKKVGTWFCFMACALLSIMAITQDEIVIVLVILFTCMLFSVGNVLACPTLLSPLHFGDLVAPLLFACATPFLWSLNVVGMVLLRGYKWSYFLHSRGSIEAFWLGLVLYSLFQVLSLYWVNRRVSRTRL